MSNAKKVAKKTKNANRKLFGLDRLRTIDSAFLDEGELQLAEEQHQLMSELLGGNNGAISLRRKDFITGEVTGTDKKGIFINVGLKYDAFNPIEEAGDLKVGDSAIFYVTSDSNDEGMVTASYTQAKAWEKLKAISESGEHVEVKVFSLAMDRRSQKVSGLRVIFQSEEFKGVRGFIPNTEVAYGSDPRTMVDTVITASIQGVDPAKGGGFGYLVLSQKDAANDIARRHIATFAPGDITSGTVVKFIKASPNDHDMSVLVNIGNGATGLIYRTEVAGYPRQKANDTLKVGETIEVEVTKVQPELNRISLSTKTLGKKRTLSLLEAGLVVEAEILRSKEYGYFVHIGDGVEGLLHVSDLAILASGKKESFKAGDRTQVVILQMTAEGNRIALGRRQLIDASAKK